MTVRHAVLAVAFAVLAGLRVADADWLWAAVFAAGAAGYAVSALSAARRRPAAAEGTSPDAVGSDVRDLPEPAVLARSLAVHERSARTWSLLTVLAAATAAGLLLVQPALAAVAAGVSLFALYRARRARRTAGTLHRITGPASPVAG